MFQNGATLFFVKKRRLYKRMVEANKERLDASS